MEFTEPTEKYGFLNQFKGIKVQGEEFAEFIGTTLLVTFPCGFWLELSEPVVLTELMTKVKEHLDEHHSLENWTLA